MLHERLALGAPAAAHDLVVDPVALREPLHEVAGQPARRGSIRIARSIATQHIRRE